ncbi:MAG: LEPR-XLL domain-containing protein, partial [Gemmatimonadetes bacterium]|nr:LEPR-XLL domain-containing protein [Gemmatimonadota bacterium]
MSKQDNLFQLEALEPRLLLSGDASALAAEFATGLDHIPVLVEHLQSSPDHLNQPIPLLGQSLTGIIDPAAQLEDLFAGLTEADLDSPEDLVNALDGESGVDAELVQRSDDGFALDLRITDVFEGIAPFAFDSAVFDSAVFDSGGVNSLEQPGAASLALYGTARLTGDWVVDLRVVTDMGNEDTRFSIDSTLSSLHVDVTVSAPVLTSGWYDGARVTDISHMQFQATFETHFSDADGGGLIDLSRLSGDGANSLVTTSSSAHAAMTLQLVETLNASNGPPSVSLVWQDLGDRAWSTAPGTIVLDTGISAQETPDVNGTFAPHQILAVSETNRSAATSARVNDAFSEPAVLLDDAVESKSGFLRYLADFAALAERVFTGLDPPALQALIVVEPTATIGSTNNVEPAFEFTADSDRPSDLTLRLNDGDLEIIDTLTGALLAARPLGRVSGVTVRGADDLDDTLTVDFSGGLIEVPIVFHGGDLGFDSLVFQGDGSVSVHYTAIGADSATLQIAGNRSGHESGTTLSFTGLEPVTLSALSSLTFSTNDPAIFADNTAPAAPGIDVILIDSPAAGQNRINGTSGAKVFENVTFFDIPTVTLDLGLNDASGNEDDQVTIDASGLVATGLQNLIINGGSGADEVILQSGISMPVAGGGVTFNGGDGDDYLVIHNSSTADITFNGGSGTDAVVNQAGTSGTPSTADVETSIDRPLLFIPGFAGTFFDDAASSLNEWLLNRGLHPSKLALEPLAESYSDLIQSFVNVGYSNGTNVSGVVGTLFSALWDWRIPVAVSSDGTNDGVLADVTAASLADALSDSLLDSGVDYLAYWLDQATSAWETLTGASSTSVDMVTHSTGGLVARSYIQSDAYGKAGNLPVVDTLVQVGVPNQGVGAPFNFLNNNFSLKSATRGLAILIDRAYDLLLSGQDINNPDGSVINNTQADPAPSQVDFVAQYVQSAQ